MASSLTHLIYHIVFSTKERCPLVTENLSVELYPYMAGIIRGEGGASLRIGGVSDHVHILTKLPASKSLSEILRRIKGNSSKWVNEQPRFCGQFAWQRGYAAFSVSQSVVERVAAYIGRQKEHHQAVSFHDELVSLLEKHGVEYDERYLLG